MMTEVMHIMAHKARRVMGLLAALVVLAGCTSSQGAPTPTPIPTMPVVARPTYTVQIGDAVEELEFSGRIAPVVEEALFFRTSGYVGNIYVQRDDRVQEGEVLAELETTDLRNQLAQAQAELEAIELGSERRLAEAQAALHTAELRLAQARVNDPTPQVTIAEVDLERAQIAYADAQEEYLKALDRTWEPEEVREAMAYSLHQAELSLRVAEALHQQAVQSRQAHTYDLQILEQEVDLAQMLLEEVEVGADVEMARLNVQRLESLLSDARISAPFDGRILSIGTSEGRMAEAYREVIVVADVSELEVSADLNQDELEQLAEGMEATIVLSNRPGEEIEGFIRVLPYPYGGGGRSTTGVEDTDRSARVSFADGVTGLNLEVGNSVRVTVIVKHKENVLCLPPEAIRTFEGREFVVVQEGEGQRRVDVRVGIEGLDCVEIEEGLTEGQVVIGP